MTQSSAALVELFSYVNRLERLPRSGWLLAGIRDVESVAAHSYGVAMVSMYLADMIQADGQKLDIERVLRIALLHDLGEAIITDIPGPTKRKMVGIEKTEREAEAKILENQPMGWRAILEEYADQNSVESRVVKIADTIQMMLMALEYERSTSIKLSEFFRKKPTSFIIAEEMMDFIISIR